jgi:probable HAF family extracellular repeat protein
MNDAGEVVGYAYFPGDAVRHAFVLRHGVKKDLGPPPGDICANAFGINSEGQVVGTSGICHGAVHAVLWEDGAAIDLNAVIPPNSGLQLVYALSINDRGEIAGIGVPPGVAAADVESLGHAFLLIPVEWHDAENTTKADSSLGPQSQEADQNDTEGTTPITQTNAVTGGMAAPPRGRQVNENQISVMRSGRFSRLPSAVRRRD